MLDKAVVVWYTDDRKRGKGVMMSKVMKTVGAFIIMLVVIGSIFVMCSKLHQYDREATVTHVWGDEVVCVDSQGQEWTFIGEGYTTGQQVILKMNDMETTSIYDDIILNVK